MVDTLTQSYRDVFEQLEADANRLVRETRFRGALSDRAARAQGVPTVAAVDETLPDKLTDKSRDAPPRLSPSA